MKYPAAVLGAFVASVVLQGCAGLIVGGAATGAAVAHDRRSAGTVLDDQNIELKAADALDSDNALTDRSHINVTSYDRSVLLTGEVANANLRAQAVRLIRGIEGVKRVDDYLVVAPSSSLGERTDDTWITTKVKSALLHVDLPDFDPTRVKVVTEARTVYLLGLVTRREGAAAVRQAGTVSGVKRIVTLFEYI